MAIKPILFNTEMVKAILEGRKTQTRRIIKLAPGFTGRQVGESGNHDNPLGFWYPCGIKRPPCNTGDILWVRETWDNIPVSPGGHFRHGGRYYYRADGDIRPEGWKGAWHPSIHMPKEAARIFLRVKDVRAERLQDISPSDIDAEGCKEWAYSAKTGELLESRPTWFMVIWDRTIKPADLNKYGWEANPWVWVIEFERCERPEGWH